MKAFSLLICAWLLSISYVSQVHGQFYTPIKTAKHSQQQLRVKNAKQAAQIAKSRYGGKVLKVQHQSGGYRVKLIKKNGHIISVFVNAATGRVG